MRPMPGLSPSTIRRPHSDSTVTQRVAGMVLALEESGNGHGFARRLADYLLTAQEVDLLQIRPLALASAWARSSAL